MGISVMFNTSFVIKQIYRSVCCFDRIPLGTTFTLLALMVVLLLPIKANADLNSADDPAFGPGSLTIDTATNLAWLDISETVGRCYLDVASEFDIGGDFEGFRFATEEEVLTLFSNAGIPDLPPAGANGSERTAANYEPIVQLLNFVGATYSSNDNAAGLTDTQAGSNTNSVRLVQARFITSTMEGSVALGSTDKTNTTSCNAAAGSWLVKPVPPPPPLISADDPVFGPGSLTVDIATNLAWLDISETVGRCYPDVSSEFGIDGDFEGFRFATEEEVLTLFSNAGIPDLPPAGANGSERTAANYEPIVQLLNFVGATYSSNDNAAGLTDTQAGSNPDWVRLVQARLITSTMEGSVALSFTVKTNTSCNASGGSWLVVADNEPLSDVDLDGEPDITDICPADPTDSCLTSGSAAEDVSADTGGTIETPDQQLTIVIGDDDLSEDTTISVTQIDPNEPPGEGEPELDISIASGEVDALAVYRFEPDGVVFDNPVTLTIEVDVSELTDEERLGLDIYRQEDTDADDIPDTFIPLIATCRITENPVETFIASCSVELAHFSLYTAASPKDSDKDHVFDDFNNEMDNCPQIANPAQTDTDNDGQGDACDTDDDNDGILDGADNCELTANPSQEDLDGDLLGDACDADDDEDGIEDEYDNCPRDDNTAQDDTDQDGDGDACDSDDDNDGYTDTADNCPLIANPDQADLDGNGEGDACDGDWDGDGAPNGEDNCPLLANSAQLDLDGDLIGDACDPDIDGDGVGNEADICAETAIGELVDPESGCSLMQLCPCDGPRGSIEPWRNHGKYVSCLSGNVNSFADAELISEEEKDDIVSEGANSSCGHKK